MITNKRKEKPMTDEIKRLDFDEGTKPTVDRLMPQGYEPWQTGGGCMAFGQNLEPLPPKRKGEYIMITNEAMTLPDWKDDQGLILVGYYHAEREDEPITAILPDLKSAVDMVGMIKAIRSDYPHVESWSDLDDNHCDANEFYPDFNDPITEEGKSQDHMDVMNIMSTWCDHVMGDKDPVFDGEIIGKGGLIGEWSGCNNADPTDPDADLEDAIESIMAINGLIRDAETNADRSTGILISKIKRILKSTIPSNLQ